MLVIKFNIIFSNYFSSFSIYLWIKQCELAIKWEEGWDFIKVGFTKLLLYYSNLYYLLCAECSKCGMCLKNLLYQVFMTSKEGCNIRTKRMLLTRKLFRWVKSWVVRCPIIPHRHKQLSLGRVVCSTPWTSQKCNDSCQWWDSDSFCCSYKTSKIRYTERSALSLWIEWSSQVIPPQFVRQVDTISYSYVHIGMDIPTKDVQ